jgi:hypothetical protein
VCRDAEVEDPASVVSKHPEDVQDLEPDRRHGEEVDRDKLLHTVVEERPPSLRRMARFSKWSAARDLKTADAAAANTRSALSARRRD